jgi:NitT/TauT family transport system permease protein
MQVDDAVAPVVTSEDVRHRTRLADRKLAVLAGCVALAAVFLGVWEWAGQTGRISKLFFSYPSAIWEALIDGINGDLLTDARYTVVAAVVGFSVAALAAIASAFVLSQLPYLFKVSRPFFIGLNSLPRVALAPLFIMWFGIGLLSHLLMAASLTFFVVFANTIAGIENVDQDHLLLALLQGASRWQTFRLFIVPSALPSIFVGLELGFIFGMLGTVSGEMIAGEHGFGVRLQRDAGLFNTNGYFATLLMLVIITSLIGSGFQIAKRRLIRWQDVHLVRRS